MWLLAVASRPMNTSPRWLKAGPGLRPVLAKGGLNLRAALAVFVQQHPSKLATHRHSQHVDPAARRQERGASGHKDSTTLLAFFCWAALLVPASLEIYSLETGS